MTAVEPLTAIESPRPPARPASGRLGLAALSPVERGVVQAVAYADVFDWPLTAVELHRYLPVPATLAEVEAALESDAGCSGFLERRGELAMLRGRSDLPLVRRRRAGSAAGLWPRALRYARLVGRLPFVRLVAITGSLAVGSARDGDDVDLFVVTAPGRVWLTRAATMLVVRMASIRGLRLCPNYLLAESDLCLPERSLFAARELAQMVPVTGLGTYERLMTANAWYRDYLPNAELRPAALDAEPRRGALTRLAETALRLRPVDPIERWEMNRKAQRLRAASTSRETRYDATCCKGHADEHGRRVLAAFEARLQRLSEVI